MVIQDKVSNDLSKEILNQKQWKNRHKVFRKYG